MRRNTTKKILRWATIAVHVIVVVSLVGMSLPSFGNIARQIGSGYIPPGYWLYPVLVLVTLALAVLVAVELVRWMHGSRRALVGVDVAVFAASWTVLVIFAFSNDLPIVTAVLAPVALLLAWKAPRAATNDPPS